MQLVQLGYPVLEGGRLASPMLEMFTVFFVREGEHDIPCLPFFENCRY